MQEKEYLALPNEQKQEYILTLGEDLLKVFLDLYQEHPIYPLIQAWCQTPINFDTFMSYSGPLNEEKQDIFDQRAGMCSLLLTVLTNLYTTDTTLYRSPNFHITFTNTDGSTGIIVVDNLQSSAECHAKSRTFKQIF